MCGVQIELAAECVGLEVSAAARSRVRSPIRRNLPALVVFMQNEISCALVCSVPLCSTLEASSGVDEMARGG